jgi:hypothetical protein
VTLSIAAASASVCRLAGGAVSFSAVGTCEVDANQGGNASYLAAAQVSQTFTVGKGRGVITVTSHATSTPVIGGGYLPTATSTSGDAVVITLGTTTACTLSAGTVHFTANGPCVIHFNDAGNASYGAATQVTQTISVGKRTLTLKASAAPAAARSSKSVRLTATLSVKTSGTVTFTAKGKVLCAATVSKGVASCKVTVALAKGSYTVTAAYDGNATYDSATATTKLTIT